MIPRPLSSLASTSLAALLAIPQADAGHQVAVNPYAFGHEAPAASELSPVPGYVLYGFERCTPKPPSCTVCSPTALPPDPSYVPPSCSRPVVCGLAPGPFRCTPEPCLAAAASSPTALPPGIGWKGEGCGPDLANYRRWLTESYAPLFSEPSACAGPCSDSTAAPWCGPAPPPCQSQSSCVSPTACDPCAGAAHGGGFELGSPTAPAPSVPFGR